MSFSLRRVGRLTFALAMSACAKPAPPRPPPQNPTEIFPEVSNESCDDAPLVDAETLVASPPGTRVAIEGVPFVGFLWCTEILCRYGCCNTCSLDGGYSVSIRSSNGTHAVVNVGVGTCEGLDCDMLCKPFGSKPRTRYRFVGPVYPDPVAPKARFAMRTERYCHVATNSSR